MKVYVKPDQQQIIITGSTSLNFQNVGTGEGEIYKETTGITASLRTLKAGPNMNISTSGDEITLSAGVTGDTEFVTEDNFTGYTASTNTRLNGIETDISSLSAITTNNGNDISSLSGYTVQLNSDFNSHTGDSTIHYAQSAITITQSQVTGLETDLNGIEGDISSLSADTAANTAKFNNYVPASGGTFTGDLTILNNLYVSGATIASEKLSTNEEFIYLRASATTAIGPGLVSGLGITNYDGLGTTSVFGSDNQGVLRIGDSGGTLQALATREDSPKPQGIAIWDDGNQLFVTTGLTSPQLLAISALTTNIDTDMVYVAKWGSDSNSGRNENYPLLTLNAAESLAETLTTGSNVVVIKVLDGGYYSTGNLTVDDDIWLDAPDATVEMRLVVRDDTQVRLGKLIGDGSGFPAINKNSGTQNAYLWINEVDVTGGNPIGMRNQGGGGILYLVTNKMTVGANVQAIGDEAGGFGHIHFEFGDLYLAGNDAVGIAGNNNDASIVARGEHILNLGAVTGTTAVSNQNADSEIYLITNQINTDTAYNCPSGKTTIICPDINGDRIGELYMEVSKELVNSNRMKVSNSPTGATDVVNLDYLTGVTDTKADKLVTINSITASTYTVVSGDSNEILEVETGCTITLPTGLTNGFQVTFVNTTTGTTSFTGGTGATLRSKDSNTTIASQYGAISAYLKDNNWTLIGDLSS